MHKSVYLKSPFSELVLAAKMQSTMSTAPAPSTSEHGNPTNPMIQLANFVETDAAFAGGSQMTYTSNSTSILPTINLDQPSSAQGITNFHLPTNSSPVPADDMMIPPPEKKRRKAGGGSKQHQLPMFLTKTYHMIEKCDSTVATWSPSGENFVVKNVEKFASSILPQYFKHSNFSSFARQLNFYGFRKLKAEPILTADYDARTANYVRFFHEKFQKDKPELLVHIKRATKSDPQSKDDVESLRAEIQHLNDVIVNMSGEFDRRIAEISFEMNTKYNTLFNKFALMQQHTQSQHSQQHTQQSLMHSRPSPQRRLSPVPNQGPPVVNAQSGNTVTAYPASNTIANAMVNSKPSLIPVKKNGKGGTGMMDNLAQACLTLKSPALPPQAEAKSQTQFDDITI